MIETFEEFCKKRMELIRVKINNFMSQSPIYNRNRVNEMEIQYNKYNNALSYPTHEITTEYYQYTHDAIQNPTLYCHICKIEKARSIWYDLGCLKDRQLYMCPICKSVRGI